MDVLVDRFVQYCKENLDLSSHSEYGYQSLSACILDCVYSLRAKYYAVTLPIVDRYAAVYMNGDRNAPGGTTSMLLEHIEQAGGPEEFADKVLRNHQVIGGISKCVVCYQLAKYLKALHIETIEDFQKFELAEVLEAVIRAVKGIGDAGVNYLFMLAGDPNRCKPDVHIHHCIRDACGKDVSNEECQELFCKAVEKLQSQHPGLTVKDLDGVIWRKYSAK